jgi:HSP20 family molecular chaperone IbpA
MMTGEPQPQTPPVQMHHADGLIVLMTPMPGLEPEDISVTLEGRTVTIRGAYRGPRHEKRGLLHAEWSPGPYERTVDLPEPVNGPLTNATYGNGIVALSMPTLPARQLGIPAAFRLEPITSIRGEHIGHTGSQLRPISTAEHRHHHDRGGRGRP